MVSARNKDCSGQIFISHILPVVSSSKICFCLHYFYYTVPVQFPTLRLCKRSQCLHWYISKDGYVVMLCLFTSSWVFLESSLRIEKYVPLKFHPGSAIAIISRMTSPVLSSLSSHCLLDEQYLFSLEKTGLHGDLIFVWKKKI